MKSVSVRSGAFSLCLSVRWKGWAANVPCSLSISFSLNDFPEGAGGEISFCGNGPWEWCLFRSSFRRREFVLG